MIEFEGYKETPMYTIEQVRKVVENVATTLKLSINKVCFKEMTTDLFFVVTAPNSTVRFVNAKLSFDVESKQPKIIISLDDLDQTWFHQVFNEILKGAEERAAYFHIKNHVGFVTRISTVLGFTETNHKISSYLLLRNELIKKDYTFGDILDNDQILFEMICFKVFSDNVVSTAESVQDLITNFDRHVSLCDMKKI